MKPEEGSAIHTVLITGGSRGIGAELVRAFAADGWRVAFLYNHSENAARELAASTGAEAIRCDVSNAPQVAEACADAVRRLRHIDALVNNAAVAQQKLFCDITDDDWRRMLDINLSGAFYVTRAVLPDMLSQQSGRIVNIASIWGQVGASCEVHYSAAKAGLIGMTKALAKEVAPSGITVNCVCPGVIQTDMLSGFDKQTLAELANETPMGRLGTPQDVAGCVCWLCGADAGFVTGQVVGVGGGFGM